MGDTPFIEKRKFPRAPLIVEILSSELPENERRSKGLLCFYSRNVSAGGIFLETAVPLKIGSIIYLRFELPGSDRPIITQAKVVRTSDDPDEVPGMGIEFQHLGYYESKAIEEYVKSCEGK